MRAAEAARNAAPRHADVHQLRLVLRRASGIETVQVIQYAARAVQLSSELFGRGLEARFLERLAQAKSNIPEFGDGRQVYEKLVRPKMVDLRRWRRTMR